MVIRWRYSLPTVHLSFISTGPWGTPSMLLAGPPSGDLEQPASSRQVKVMLGDSRPIIFFIFGSVSDCLWLHLCGSDNQIRNRASIQASSRGDSGAVQHPLPITKPRYLWSLVFALEGDGKSE